MSDGEKTTKTCFVIGPIGEEGSDTRNRADMLLEYIIKPAVQPLGFEAVRADGVDDPGTITDQVINRTLDAELVIADLTDQNANAFYELGIRHSAGMPTVHMILDGQSAPFDLSDQRHVKYKLNHPGQHVAARDDLRAKVAATLEQDYTPQNPVTRARGHASLSDSEDSKDQLIAGLMETVSRLDHDVQALKDIPPQMAIPTRPGYGLGGLALYGARRARGVPMGTGLLTSHQVEPAPEVDDE